MLQLVCFVAFSCREHYDVLCVFDTFLQLSILNYTVVRLNEFHNTQRVEIKALTIKSSVVELRA